MKSLVVYVQNLYMSSEHHFNFLLLVVRRDYIRVPISLTVSTQLANLNLPLNWNFFSRPVFLQKWIFNKIKYFINKIKQIN